LISISFTGQNPIWVFKILLIVSQECEFDLFWLCGSVSFWQIVDSEFDLNYCELNFGFFFFLVFDFVEEEGV
jgi:hypothetical protein